MWGSNLGAFDTESNALPRNEAPYKRLKESMMGLRSSQDEEISGKFSDYSSLIRGSAEDETNNLETSLRFPC